MKFPKLWGGPNQVGERKLSELNRLDTPYLTAVLNGATSYKRNLFDEVHTDKQNIEGAFCIGQIQPNADDAAPAYVVASVDGRTFSNRGKFFTQVDFATPAILPLGGGVGYVVNQEQLFPDGTAQDELYVTYYKTRDGRSFKQWFGFPISFPPSTLYGNTVTGLDYPAAYALGPTTGRPCWVLATSLVTIDLDDPQPAGHLDNYYGVWTPQLYRAEGDVWTASPSMLGIEGRRHGIPLGGRATPYHIVLCTPIYVTPDSGAGAPAPLITWTTDNGQTFTFSSDSAAFMTNIIDPLTSPTNYNPTFDQSATAVAESFRVFPKDKTSCYISAVRRKTATPARPRYVGEMNLTTGAISNIHQMSGPDNGTLYLSIIGYAWSRGWHVFFYGDRDAPTEYVKCWRTQDFTYWEQFVTVFRADQVGRLSEADPETLVVTYHDGVNFVFYTSRDAGVTWYRRGVVRANTPADPDTALGLSRFSQITYLRRNGLALPVNLGRPWVTDYRKSPS